MNPQPLPETPATSSLGVNDILFTVFRHKWKIIACTLLGAAAAAGIWFTKKPQFQSNARILIKYVSDTKSALDAGQADIRSPDARGATVMNSEIAILTSGDSIVAAARAITPQRVLAAYGGGTNVNDAASVIAGNFDVGVGRNSSVLELSFRHRDPQVAQDVLQQLIRNYQRRHLEVHRAGAAYDELQQQTDIIRTRLLQTEAELRRQKAAIGVIDLPQSKQDLAVQISALRKEIFDTEAELTERRVQAGVRNIPEFMQRDNSNSVSSSGVGAKLDVAEIDAGRNVTNTNGPNQSDLARFEMYIQKLNALKSKELELAIQYREGSKVLQQHRQQISETEQAIKALGIDPASLASRPNPVTQVARGPMFDAEGAVAGIRGLEAKLALLTNQLARVRQEAERIDGAEDLIAQTERRKSLEEAQYTYYAKSLEQARLDQALDATKLNNMYVAQEPSVAVPATDKKLKKLAAGALVGGLVVGLGLAFLLDLILDSSVKRRKELEGLQLPVFLTIPDFGRNGHSKLKTSGSSAAVALVNGEEAWANGEIPPWEESDPMLPYYEALRDRVVMSYGEDPHKPKIVGVTSCNEGAGVTRLATGMAAALSRDVDRNVLLIALAKGKVAVSAFSKGRPTDGFGSPALDSANQTGADLEKNLYSLVATGKNLAGASIVQSFSDLLPRMKVSDYDFIVFDLPPITQTSGSLRLAAQMERTLLVVEAERTSKEKVRNVKAQLSKSKTQVAAVLNVAKQYGPKAVESEV